MIKKWFQDLFGKKSPIGTIEWQTDDSILAFLSSHIGDNGRLTAAANDLPDEEKDENEIRFAPGLMDAMFGSSESDESKAKIGELSGLLKKIAHQGDKSSEAQFYSLVTQNQSVIDIIDAFLQTIVDDGLPIQPYLFNYAKELATRTDKRNAVKFGIAIAGLCQQKSLLNDIQILGLHDEFTVFAAIAIANISDNAEDDLWELAQKVDGWGKIQLVDRLAVPGLKPSIKDWLLLEGYKNNIMHEYLAYTCAFHGELHLKLQKQGIEHRLFKSAAEILLALISEHSPAQDITTYPYASQVVHDFIRHAKVHAGDVAGFHVLHKLKDFLTALQADLCEQWQNGWTQDVISNCLIEIFALLNHKDWKTIVEEGLNSKDHETYWYAQQASEKLGVDVWDSVWRRLNDNPLDSAIWYDVTQYGKPDFADDIVAFALQHLPLAELATGAKDSNGFGPLYAKHTCLEHATGFLKDHPQKGTMIVLAALKSPVTRVRNRAISVLDNWKQENWSPEIAHAVKHLQGIEPNPDTQANLGRLLNGEALQ